MKLGSMAALLEKADGGCTGEGLGRGRVLCPGLSLSQETPPGTAVVPPGGRQTRGVV